MIFDRKFVRKIDRKLAENQFKTLPKHVPDWASLSEAQLLHSYIQLLIFVRLKFFFCFTN